MRPAHGHGDTMSVACSRRVLSSSDSGPMAALRTLSHKFHKIRTRDIRRRSSKCRPLSQRALAAMHCRVVGALNDKIKNRSENQEPSGRTIAASYCKETLSQLRRGNRQHRRKSYHPEKCTPTRPSDRQAIRQNRATLSGIEIGKL